VPMAIGAAIVGGVFVPAAPVLAWWLNKRGKRKHEDQRADATKWFTIHPEELKGWCTSSTRGPP